MVLLYLQHANLLPERELLVLLTKGPKRKSVSEVEKEKAEREEKEKAEKKKAEHKRYKAKKKAEAAAKREAEKEAAEEVTDKVAEAPESSKSQAELQAEEDARLGDRRIQLQAKRQEQEDKLASLVIAKKGSSSGSKERVFNEGRKK